MQISSPFVFATCRAGSEKALKEEVKSRHGDLLTPAFMRPQLITWKSTKPLDQNFVLGAYLGRVAGVSLGASANDEELVENALVMEDTPFHLHVFPRTTSSEEDIPDTDWAAVDLRRDEIAEKLRAAGLKVHAPAKPHGGDWIVDVILDDDITKPSLLGLHRHAPARHPMPGALTRITLPAEAPSRAFLKLEQALVWAGLDAEGALKGTIALELGSSPGGATYAMLRRGIEVIGVDPGPMDAMVLSYAETSGVPFKHLKMSVGAVKSADLPKNIDLLVCDMNLAPPVVIHYLEGIQRRVKANMMILTLKLNDNTMLGRIPEFLARLKRFAPMGIKVLQLPANRSEICVIAGKL